jgi:phage terminase large subunit GpA-like protein
MIIQEQRSKNWKERFDWWLEDNWTSRGKPIDFKNERKYLKELYNTFDKQKVVVMSSSQAGKTEWLISEAVYSIDQFNWNCIYFLPTEKNFGQFVNERVDEPITNNQHLTKSVKQEKTQGVKDKIKDSVAVKKLKGRIYFKGTQNTLSMKSTPGDVVYVDELDEMDTDKVPLIQKRLHNSNIKKERWASTPTLPNLGIHAKYKESDQREYFIQCPHCKKWQTITFWDNVKWEEIDGEVKNERIECAYCNKKILPYKCEGE